MSKLSLKASKITLAVSSIITGRGWNFLDLKNIIPRNKVWQQGNHTLLSLQNEGRNKQLAFVNVHTGRFPSTTWWLLKWNAIIAWQWIEDPKTESLMWQSWSIYFFTAIIYDSMIPWVQHNHYLIFFWAASFPICFQSELCIFCISQHLYMQIEHPKLILQQ